MKYEIGDKIVYKCDDKEEYGRVTRIEINTKVWAIFDSNSKEAWFYDDDESFELVERTKTVFTPSAVRTVLKAYQDYAKIEYMPEYVHKEIFEILNKPKPEDDPDYEKYLELKKKFENS